MDIKELNNAIPAELKLKLKEFVSKFNTEPVGVPVAPAVPAEPVQFGESLLSDGVTVVKYNTPELGEGTVITVVTPEGEVNAPEGEHTLQDGTVITVAIENGVSVVKAVTPPAVAEAPVEPQMNVAEVKSQISGFKSQVEKLESEKSELSLKFEAQKKEVSELKENVGQFIKLFSEILELPSSNPIEVPRNKHSIVNKQLDKILKINSKN